MKRQTARFLAASVTALLIGISGLGADTNEPWVAPSRAARKKNPTAMNENSLAAGKAVFAKECRSCHGDSGVGDGPAAKDLTKPPGNLTTAKFWEQSDGALFWKITEGRKPMPSFETLLTEEQRWNVVNYLHTFAPKGSK